MGTVYGYARVSTREQNLARQLAALREFGVEEAHIFADKASGRDFDRPEWSRLMGGLAQGDVLAVKSIDRLGRSYEEVIGQWRRVTKDVGAAIVVLDMPLLDTRERPGGPVDGITGVFIGDLVLQLLSYVAQVERENIKQRQAEGIAAARARGVRLGRPAIDRPPAYEATKGLYLAGEINRREASARLGVCPSTFDRWLKRDAQGS